MNKLSKKRICFVIVTIFSAISLLFSFTYFNNNEAYAYCEENYKEAGLNFLEFQYELNDIEYEELTYSYSINLYDTNDRVIAKILVVNRDDEIDYAILDFLADTIISFGFNSKDFLQKFNNKGNIYYAGQLNFAYKTNGVFYDLDNSLLDVTEFVSAMNDYELVTPEINSGYDGIISWKEVVREAEILDPTLAMQKRDYIYGFNYCDFVPETFYSQDTLNESYNKLHPDTFINGTCSPTAMANMAAYFKWADYENALINDSVYDTFEWLIDDLKWFDWNASNWWTNTKNTFVNYAKKINYNYTINNYDNPTINDFIYNIERDCPIYTYLKVTQTNGRVWAHAVVTVGYVRFTQTYQNKETYYYYLRCIDGWGTANSPQYIKFDNFYDKFMASAFRLI